MNLLRSTVTAFCLAVCFVLCPPLRADDMLGAPESSPSLDQMRFAARWPDAQPQQTPLPAVVRVIATDRNSMSLGSGTLVDANDQYGLIVTNWHVVRDAVGSVEVVFPDGFHSMASIIRTDKEWDLAALLIWKPAVQPVPVSTAPPQPGEVLTIAGYGSGDYKMQSGPCTQYLSPAPGRPMEIVELAAAARHGDSGGPILNSRGELAGVLFGEGGGHTDGSYGGRVNEFLKLAATDLRSLPATNVTNGAPNPAMALAANRSAVPPSESGGSKSQTKMGGSLDPNGVRSPAQFAGGIGDPGSDQGLAAKANPTTADGWSESAWPKIADRSGTQPVSAADARGKPLSLAADQANMPTDAQTVEKTISGKSGFAWAEELKSFLAAAGVAAILLHVIRWFGAKE